MLTFPNLHQRANVHTAIGDAIVTRAATEFRAASNDQERKPGSICQAMDTVELTRKGLTNQLRLVKYFAQASDAP